MGRKDRELDPEDRAAIAKEQEKHIHSRPNRFLQEKITKAVEAGQQDARKHQHDHPDP